MAAEKPRCIRCQGTGWICSEHSLLSYRHDDCRGRGDPCPFCNLDALPPSLRHGNETPYGPRTTLTNPPPKHRACQHCDAPLVYRETTTQTAQYAEQWDLY